MYHRSRKHKWVRAMLGCRVEVCVIDMSFDESNDWEIAMISQMGTFTTSFKNSLEDIRCNFTRGGGGMTGRTRPKSERFRISESLKAKKLSRSVETRQRMSEGQRIACRSAKTKQAKSEAAKICQRARFADPAQRLKISQSLKVWNERRRASLNASQDSEP